MAEPLPHFETLLRPETPLEMLLVSTPEFREGYAWGIPRYGHPEGKVGLHVREVLDNIELLQADAVSRARLRLVALSHDTFKYREYRQGRRLRHHGLLARDFVENYVDDAAVLDLIELHDEAFYIWRMQAVEQRTEQAQERLTILLQRLGEHTRLYFQFYQCDTQTGDKVQAPLEWFENILAAHDQRFTSPAPPPSTNTSVDLHPYY